MAKYVVSSFLALGTYVVSRRLAMVRQLGQFEKLYAKHVPVTKFPLESTTILVAAPSLVTRHVMFFGSSQGRVMFAAEAKSVFSKLEPVCKKEGK